MVAIKSLIIREWETPDIANYREKGDFYTISGLYIDPQTGYIRRCPAWSARVAMPETITSYSGAFYDQAQNICLIVQNHDQKNTPSTTLNVLAYAQQNFFLYGNTILNDTEITLTGHRGQNIVAGNNLYYIAGNSVYGLPMLDIYDDPPDHTVIYTSGSDVPRIIRDIAGILFIFTENSIFRYDGSSTTLYYTHNLGGGYGINGIMYATPMHGHIILLETAGGRLNILRLSLSNNPTLNTVTTLAGYGMLGMPILASAMHQGSLYFIPERSEYQPRYPFSVYRFDGTGIQKLQTFSAPNASDMSLRSFADTLMLTVKQSGASPLYYILHTPKHKFAPWISPPSGSITYFPPDIVAHRIITHNVLSDLHGFHYTTTALADGYIETSWFDMGDPTKQKQLLRIAVTLDGAVADFKVVVKYRVNYGTSWTTATTANGSQHIILSDLNTQFHTLQVRLEIDDDSTGGNKDYAITTLSITYSIE